MTLPFQPSPRGGWQCCTIVSSAKQDVVVTVSFDDEGMGLVCCSHTVFDPASDVHGQVQAWLVPSKVAISSRLHPPGAGRVWYPYSANHHVTSLLERRHTWQRLVQMDGVTRANVMGKLSYPHTCWCITPYLPNHKSWEVD